MVHCGCVEPVVPGPVGCVVPAPELVPEPKAGEVPLAGVPELVPPADVPPIPELIPEADPSPVALPEVAPPPNKLEFAFICSTRGS